MSSLAYRDYVGKIEIERHVLPCQAACQALFALPGKILCLALPGIAWHIEIM